MPKQRILIVDDNTMMLKFWQRLLAGEAYECHTTPSAEEALEMMEALTIDVLKGSFAVVFALIFMPALAQWAGIVAVIGHIWPLWLMFKGGKGVATSFGVLLMLNWILTLACFGTWTTFAIMTRYSSLASLITFLLSSFYALFVSGESLVITCLILTALIFWTHRHNIDRLRKGKEPKIGDPTSPPTTKR